MSGLSILSDDHVNELLEGLKFDDLELFRSALKTALHEYSNGTQAVEECSIHQPHRTVINSPHAGTTSLFMPCASSAGLGIKVVTLSGAEANAADDKRTVIRPTGAITLFAPDGRPVGILHASTLTAFRTALASACLVMKRTHVREIAVFGSGLQAYWHVRLALMLRGASVRRVNIINRRFSANCEAVLRRLHAVSPEVREREGWPDASFSVLTPQFGEFDRLHREHVRAADVVFCCTPSTEPLFDPAILTSHEGRRKGRLIVAIGSYTPQMRELPLELLRQATAAREGTHRHFHKHAREGGVVVVDTLDGALREAGEIIEAGLGPNQLVELGELVMLHRIHQEDQAETAQSSQDLADDFDKLEMESNLSGTTEVGTTSSSSTNEHRKSLKNVFRRRSSSPGSPNPKKFESKSESKDEQMLNWLSDGNVIYKSVGLGLMDLVVGMHLVQYSIERGVGDHIPGF